MKWHTAKYDDPYSEFVLCINPSKCTHTIVNTHTHTHTHSVLSTLNTTTEVLLSKAPNPVHSLPHLQYLPARDSNSQPLYYESDSLTLGHHFPYVYCHNIILQVLKSDISTKFCFCLTWVHQINIKWRKMYIFLAVCSIAFLFALFSKEKEQTNWQIKANLYQYLVF